jgi:FkbM family methyltransferase
MRTAVAWLVELSCADSVALSSRRMPQPKKLRERVTRELLKHELKSLVELVTNSRGTRSEVEREYFFRLARRFTPTLAAPVQDGVLFVSTDDIVVGRSLFVHGGQQADAAADAVRLLSAPEGLGVRVPGATMVEIGANIGSTSLSALKRYGVDHVIAFEPFPWNAALLRQNMLVNGLLDQVSIHEMALSDRDGTMPLLVSAENSGDHRLVSAPDGRTAGAFGEATWESLEVPVRSWDSLVSDGSLELESVSFVWMDVQGHEGQVLAGAKTLVGSAVPVVTEFWPYGLRRAGGLDLLEGIVEEHYAGFVDLHSLEADRALTVHPAVAIRELAGRYDSPEAHTDLVLIPATAARGALLDW